MTKLLHDIAERRTFVAAGLSNGGLLPQTYILLGEKLSTVRWAEHLARFRGMMIIIIEKPKR
jgi:hypothetical protein